MTTRIPRPDDVNRDEQPLTEIKERRESLRLAIVAVLKQAPGDNNRYRVLISDECTGDDLIAIRQELAASSWTSHVGWQGSQRVLVFWHEEVPVFPGELPSPDEATARYQASLAPAIATLKQSVNRHLTRQPDRDGEYWVPVRGVASGAIEAVRAELTSQGWQTRIERGPRDADLVIWR